MLVFIIPGLIWIALTMLIVAVCQVADFGDRALANGPSKSERALTHDPNGSALDLWQAPTTT